MRFDGDSVWFGAAIGALAGIIFMLAAMKIAYEQKTECMTNNGVELCRTVLVGNWKVKE